MTAAPAASAVDLTLRAPLAEDRTAIERMLRDAGVFRDGEVAIGLEVFDGSVAGDAAYHSVVAELGGGVAGWICWGPTPCTVGTWDMYGLAVSPANPDVVYAIIEAAEKGGFHRSLDGGGNWEKMSDYVSGSPQYYNECIADPWGESRV